MRFEVEGRAPIESPAEKEVRNAIAALRSYGPHSFASVTDKTGNYLQAAGGGQSCFLERREAQENRHFRAFQDKKSKVFADGTTLSFSGGDVPLRADEWLSSDIIAEAFCAFLTSRPLPALIRWRDITETLIG